MGSFSKKGNFLNLIEGFSKYYKYHRMIKNEKTLTAPKLASFSKSVFEEIQSMLSETTHGIILKDFGTIVPRDTMIEYNNGRFKKSIKYKCS